MISLRWKRGRFRAPICFLFRVHGDCIFIKFLSITWAMEIAKEKIVIRAVSSVLVSPLYSDNIFPVITLIAFQFRWFNDKSHSYSSSSIHSTFLNVNRVIDRLPIDDSIKVTRATDNFAESSRARRGESRCSVNKRD